MEAFPDAFAPIPFLLGCASLVTEAWQRTSSAATSNADNRQAILDNTFADRHKQRRGMEMSMMGTSQTSASSYRWVQRSVGIIGMVMIANYQYGWTLFVLPIDQKYHWGRASIQVAFTIFVLLETWLVPVEGWFVDRYGPKIVVAIGGVLIPIAWALDSVAASLPTLWGAAPIARIGCGPGYRTAPGNALKWFADRRGPAARLRPAGGNALKWFADRRGFAAGLTAAGFGAGSALTIIPIQNMITSSGYENTFLWFGLGQGAVVLVMSLFMAAPAPGQAPAARPAKVRQTARDYSPVEVVQSPIFWVMYVMFVLVGAGGLMATAQLAPIANDWGIAKTPVSLVGLTLPALTSALSIDRILNGVTRPFFGWVSDNIGRESTMFIAFGLEAA